MAEDVGFVNMAGKAATGGAPTLGIGMLCYAFIVKTHTNSLKKLPSMMYPPVATPRSAHGFARTSSPPYPGVTVSGTYTCGVAPEASFSQVRGRTYATFPVGINDGVWAFSMRSSLGGGRRQAAMARPGHWQLEQHRN